MKILIVNNNCSFDNYYLVIPSNTFKILSISANK